MGDMYYVYLLPAGGSSFHFLVVILMRGMYNFNGVEFTKNFPAPFAPGSDHVTQLQIDAFAPSFAFSLLDLPTSWSKERVCTNPDMSGYAVVTNDPQIPMA